MAQDVPQKPKPQLFWAMYMMPFVLAGTAAGAYLTGGFVEDAYTDWGFPLLVTTWVGMGFTYAWDSVKYSMHAERFPPLMIAAVGAAGGLILLSMLGIETLWEEPWLFGVAVWPGFLMARPVFERWLATRSLLTTIEDTLEARPGDGEIA